MIKQESTFLFGGQIGNFRKDFDPPTDDKRAFEKKHLKAYLKGHTLFFHGKTVEGKPKAHLVIRIPAKAAS